MISINAEKPEAKVAVPEKSLSQLNQLRRAKIGAGRKMSTGKASLLKKAGIAK